jgi:protein TonB
MYDSSKGLLIGFIAAILIVFSLGFSVKEYEPKITKRKKYKTVKMKILPKKEPKKEEIVKEEIKKPEIEPKKVEKKEKIIPKEKKKKIKPKKKKIVAKKPINQKKEEPKKTEEPKKKSPPVFGVTMNSVNNNGNSNFKVKVGNTLMTDDSTGWENGKPKEIGEFNGTEEEAKDGVKEVKKTPPPKIVSKPIPKKVFRPKYSKLAEDQEIEGKIILKLTIDEKGDVVKAKIIKGLGYGLDEEALKAVKKFKFSPAVLSNGKTKKTSITYTINFILEE